MRTDPARRRLLLAAVAGSPLLVASCKGIQVLGPPPGPGADVTSLEAAITAERELVGQYQDALPAFSGHPGTSAVLSTVLAEHQAHLTQLRARLILPRRTGTASPGGQATAGTKSPAAGTAGTAGTGQAGGGPAQALASLRAAEHAATARLTNELTRVPGPLAQLMAAISAAEAAHAVVLTQVGLR